MTNALINRSYPYKPALITAQGEITYAQLLTHIQYYANLFRSKGYQRVAIYAENSPSWIFAFYKLRYERIAGQGRAENSA